MTGVVFHDRLLPYLLLAPQLAVTAVFFFWPAGQALYQSVLTQDAFGTTVEFVGLENFERLFGDPTYLASFKTTAVFSVLVASIGLTIALLLAVMAAGLVGKGAAAASAGLRGRILGAGIAGLAVSVGLVLLG
ncbi:MAG: sugar ABC transporter permease, partial [Oceanibaculum sp.]